MFHEESYDRHIEWYNQHFPTASDKVDYYRKTKAIPENTISVWLQNIFFHCLDPLLSIPTQHWLTVGDAYGFDAQYILSKGNSSLATDLNTDFLSVAKEEGIVKEYAAENAEHLSFNDNSFDYVLCKESYHHFPRPYAALYEMIRVAKKGIVIIEPQDPVSKMPLLLMMNNLLSGKAGLLKKVWKNRFSYEPVGNFVYKVSEREFEKFAAGLGLPMVAFKKINPNFYFKGAENIKTNDTSRKVLAIKAKKGLLDLLSKTKLVPAQVMAAIVFKEVPEESTLQQLKADGYHLVSIPKNPYVNN
ncbi:class I SAM-dependent methyltransferase [Pedobacter sp. L105]|uniref:class I SAM-dependent methyltransferase n=1 Tax=Pedobacter sp. L105 TaxID=1641871 RepID=UPI00131C6CF2|nr:class I SAM-dependent methyltransferase [Pedobacter sp. L105]